MKTLILVISLLMFSCGGDVYHSNTCFIVKRVEICETGVRYYLDKVNTERSGLSLVESKAILFLDSVNYKIGDTLKLGIVK